MGSGPQPLPELLVIEDPVARDAAAQMALDEALLRRAELPVLRFYRWAAHAVTFGYFGRFAEVEPLLAGRDVARRWTGGGIVEHGADTTYALVIPRGLLERMPRARALYREVHAVLAGALAGGLTLQSAGTSAGGLCFQRPVEGDLMDAATKIAGAAQRRSREGILQQGSVVRPMDPAQRRAFAHGLAAVVREPVAIEPETERLALELVSERYGTPEWLGRL